jgi:hypothetical protein
MYLIQIMTIRMKKFFQVAMVIGVGSLLLADGDRRRFLAIGCWILDKSSSSNSQIRKFGRPYPEWRIQIVGFR